MFPGTTGGAYSATAAKRRPWAVGREPWAVGREPSELGCGRRRGGNGWNEPVDVLREPWFVMWRAGVRAGHCGPWAVHSEACKH